MPENHKLQMESPTPTAIGTRCNELAMMVVYESPLQVMCDAPYNYRSSPAGTDFLKFVPTTWDETMVIHGYPGDFITTARRAGEEWYVGSMTDMEARTLSISLDFLGEGTYEATVWKDAEDSFDNPTHLETEVVEADRSSVIDAEMTPGGGHVIHLKPKG